MIVKAAVWTTFVFWIHYIIIKMCRLSHPHQGYKQNY